MSEGQPGDRLDHTGAAKEQIREIGAIAKGAGKLPECIELLKQAVDFLQTDPIGWGDPVYNAIDAVVYRGVVRPLAFRYVVYEQVRSVVLLNVRLYADFA